MPGNSSDPLSLRDTLTSTYLRYIDTAYWLSDAELVAERRALLLDESMLSAEVFLEPVRSYAATEDLATVCERVGVPRDSTQAVVGRSSVTSPPRGRRSDFVSTRPKRWRARFDRAGRTDEMSS